MASRIRRGRDVLAFLPFVGYFGLYLAGSSLGRVIYYVPGGDAFFGGPLGALRQEMAGSPFPSSASEPAWIWVCLLVGMLLSLWREQARVWRHPGRGSRTLFLRIAYASFAASASAQLLVASERRWLEGILLDVLAVAGGIGLVGWCWPRWSRRMRRMGIVLFTASILVGFALNMHFDRARLWYLPRPLCDVP